MRIPVRPSKRSPASRSAPSIYRDEDDNLLACGGWLAALRPRAPIHLLLLAKEGGFRCLLCAALEQRGHQICAVNNLEEAQGSARLQRFDVALLLVGPQGAAQMQIALRELDPDLEVVWMPPPISIPQAEALVQDAAERGRRRMSALCGAARLLLEPVSPETAAARLIEQAEDLFAGRGMLAPAEPEEPQEVLISPDRRRLRVPLWVGGPAPERSRGQPETQDEEEQRPEEEDSGHRLELSRGIEGPAFSRGELERATVLGAIGSLALTRSHCEQVLSELYREMHERILDRFGARIGERFAERAALANSEEGEEESEGGRAQSVEALVAERAARTQVDVNRGGDPLAEQGLTSSAIGPLERLAGVLAHELNNPLTFVLANLSCLKDELNSLRDCLEQGMAGQALGKSQEMVEVLNEVLGGAGRVREVVADLTTLGTRGEGDGAQRPVVIEEVVRAALRIARREVQRRAQVVVDIEPRLPPVMGSASRLGQVVLNLLLNAVQAVPHGAAGTNEVRIRARAQGGDVVICISDTGSGIEEDMLPRVFEPGYTTKPGGQGSGLGLAISREIVRAHGGEIYIESQAGRGTTVSVVLPVRRSIEHGGPSNSATY